MLENLLELPLKELLVKIGKGKHVPGSGSVAALNGLLSCELIATVLSLTLRPNTLKSRKSFEDQFKEIILDVETNIKPSLEILFQQDSDEFNQLMEVRFARRDSENQFQRNILTADILKKQVITTETPVLIAKHCIVLAEYALFLFENAYSVVRGDSGVAVSNALTGLHGTINIISLNLVDFPEDDWTILMHKELLQLKSDYDKLKMQHENLTKQLREEAIAKNKLKAEFASIKKMASSIELNKNNISTITSKIQNALWKHKKTIWPKRETINEIEILDYKKAIKLFDYALEMEESLGRIDTVTEIGGICNNSTCTISISTMFEPERINFTGAHELGHALLHTDEVLHRDISLAEVSHEKNRPLKERQADIFSANFLMPQKTITKLFKERFKSEKLLIDDYSAFNLNYFTVDELIDDLKTTRSFSRKIASTKFFGDKVFDSLAKRFNVSTEAMAIRLEEIGLV